MALKFTALAGGTTSVAEEVVEAFAAGLRGCWVPPDAKDYDDVRAIWNAMVDRRPGGIVRCAGAADVMRSVRFASEHGLLMSIRGAGHNIAGNAVYDGALMIDLSRMTSVRVDPATRKAWVEPGATLGDLDRETQAHALAVPVGINSTTGIAGLTLGGGFGWLSRKHGLTIDSLLSADVVTTDGRLVRASADENPDLFWGLRGGGGNFGIVTSFEFRLHPVGPEVFCGFVVHPYAAGREVLNHYREFCRTATDDVTVWVILRKAPPLPFLPEAWHGKEVVVLAMVCAGAVEAGEAATKGLREFGEPVGTHTGPMPFTAFQAAFDPLLTPGARNYWKSHNFEELSDEALDAILRNAGSLPTGPSEIFIAQLGGATSRVASDATAYQHRDANFVLNVHTRWEAAEDDERCIAWARAFFAETAPYATGGVYVNFMPDDEADRVTAAYGGNYERLRTLKAKYDPDNRLRLNQNIAPA